MHADYLDIEGLLGGGFCGVGEKGSLLFRHGLERG